MGNPGAQGPAGPAGPAGSVLSYSAFYEFITGNTISTANVVQALSEVTLDKAGTYIIGGEQILFNDNPTRTQYPYCLGLNSGRRSDQHRGARTPDHLGHSSAERDEHTRDQRVLSTA